MSSNYDDWTDDPTAWEQVPCERCGCLPENLTVIKIFPQRRFMFVECPKCRLRFYSPRLKQDERWIKNCFQNKESKAQAEILFETATFGSIDDPQKQIAFTENYYAKRLGICVARLGRYPKSIFEIGAGSGRLLTVAKRCYPGVFVSGCEPNPYSADICKEKFEIDIQKTIFSKAKVRGDAWDIVIGWNVIEHTFTPCKDIARMVRMLRSGGVLMLRTFFEEANILTNEYTDPISHQYHFFKDVLAGIILDNGLSITVELAESTIYVIGKKL